MKERFKKVFYIVDDFAYFLPDIFLVLFIVSLFKHFGGKYHLEYSCLLLITYLSVSYGEYLYSKFKFAKFFVDDLINSRIDGIARSINEQKFMTMDAMDICLDIVEMSMDEKIDNLRRELKESCNDEMDSKEASQELQRK